MGGEKNETTTTKRNIHNCNQPNKHSHLTEVSHYFLEVFRLN